MANALESILDGKTRTSGRPRFRMALRKEERSYSGPKAWSGSAVWPVIEYVPNLSGFMPAITHFPLAQKVDADQKKDSNSDLKHAGAG